MTSEKLPTNRTPDPQDGTPKTEDPTVEAAGPRGPADPAQTDEPRKLDLSLTQTVGGALAAMTAAALGSRLGVAGTIVGAAVASIIAGVGGSLYTASLRHTREKVQTVWSSRGGAAKGPVSTSSGPSRPTPATHEEIRPEPRSGRPVPSSVPWKSMLIGAGAVFAIAVAALTGFEFISGGAISGGQGTTVEQVTKPRQAQVSPSAKSTPADSATPSASASTKETPTVAETPVPSDLPTTQESLPGASDAPSQPVESQPAQTGSPSLSSSPGDTPAG